MYKESELTGKIIGTALSVHRDVGQGFQERIYHRAMIVALRNAGMKVESEKEYDIQYQDTWIGTFRLDLVVENKVVVELKAVHGEIPKLFYTQTISYLKASNMEVGLLINFSNESLNVKRFANYAEFNKQRNPK
jgi:GxxExxY protein